MLVVACLGSLCWKALDGVWVVLDGLDCWLLAFSVCAWQILVDGWRVCGCIRCCWVALQGVALSWMLLDVFHFTNHN